MPIKSTANGSIMYHIQIDAFNILSTATTTTTMFCRLAYDMYADNYHIVQCTKCMRHVPGTPPPTRGKEASSPRSG